MGIPKLHVRGDSVVNINWMNSKLSLIALNLEHWCNIIYDIMQAFLSLDIKHIYREYNKSAGGLSNEAFKMMAGHLHFS